MRHLHLAAALAALLGLPLALGACSGGAASDADAAETGPDAAGDAADDAPGDAAADVDHDADAAPDAACQPDAWRCSEDAATLSRCEAGAWVDTDCAAARKLCDEGACVEPWRWGSPAWGTCPDGPSTPESLADKAAYYDAIAARLHVHPALKFIATVELKREEVSCAPGQAAPCFAPLVPEDEATWGDVERFVTDANDGLWSSLYLTSQAYRYAVTGAPEALAMIELLLDGERDRMAITGVPGLFARRLIPPGVAGASCPEDAKSYQVDAEKDDDRWVRVGQGGCIEAVDADGQWFTSERCGLEKYAGWCWYDNVSQDEYAGHMLALGAVMQLVDDAAVRAVAAELLRQIGLHLATHELQFIDWDGRPTEHGLIGMPAMALGWLATAAAATQDPTIEDFYHGCLLQQDGPRDCLSLLGAFLLPLSDNLELLAAYNGDKDCRSNWNTQSMAFASLSSLLWFADDPALRARAREVFDTALMSPPGATKPMLGQNNPWWTFFWAAWKAHGPDEPGPLLEEVEAAVCQLRRFPASEHQPAIDASALYATDCIDRLDNPLAAEPIPPELHCPTKFLWWFNPYEIESCEEQTWRITQPQDFLLPYWMGRYYGFIGPDA
ncbi:MAG: hypothetical protein H6744_13085 [Deltaproteobacteria bacterium]|nr:hypothetical protein [Deltaproteobacteria bacterium]